MLLNLFTSLYTWIPNVDRSTLNDVALLLFILTVSVSAATSAIYYLVINNWKLGFQRTGHWFIMLSLNGAIVLGLSILQGIGSYGVFAPFIGIIGAYNVVLASLLFYLFSFIFKRFSKLASKTPH